MKPMMKQDETVNIPMLETIHIPIVPPGTLYGLGTFG
jgi:hypothetical protein